MKGTSWNRKRCKKNTRRKRGCSQRGGGLLEGIFGGKASKIRDKLLYMRGNQGDLYNKLRAYLEAVKTYKGVTSDGFVNIDNYYSHCSRAGGGKKDWLFAILLMKQWKCLRIQKSQIIWML